MISGFIIAIALVLGGLAVMRFGIFQIRKFKKGETKVSKKISEQIAFVVFFLIILGLIIYSVNDLLFLRSDKSFSNLAVVVSSPFSSFCGAGDCIYCTKG